VTKFIRLFVIVGHTANSR